MIGRIAVLFAAVVPVLAQTGWISQPQSAAPSDFAIMAWNPSVSGAGQLAAAHEAGLNISGFCSVEALNEIAAVGLSCLVDDKRANGYDWLHLPPDDVLRKNIQSLVAETRSKPAAFGFFLADEPGATAMPGLGRVAALLREAAPGKIVYVNLFPTYASREQLGTDAYKQYLRQFLDSSHPQVVSYDNYSIIGGEMLDRFYTNLEAIRRLTVEARLPFWNVILANTTFNFMEPSAATLNLQVYATLAYGGRGISYFTYVTPPIGNFRLGAIDQFGNQTPTWSLLRTINNQVHALAPVLVKLRSTGVYHAPEVPEASQPLSDSRLIASVRMKQQVENPVPARYLVGEFEDAAGRPYFMIVNKELSQSFEFAIELKRTEGKLIHISPYTGREEPFGGEQNWLAPGAGALFRVE